MLTLVCEVILATGVLRSYHRILLADYAASTSPPSGGRRRGSKEAETEGGREGGSGAPFCRVARHSRNEKAINRAGMPPPLQLGELANMFWSHTTTISNPFRSAQSS